MPMTANPAAVLPLTLELEDSKVYTFPSCSPSSSLRFRSDPSRLCHDALSSVRCRGQGDFSFDVLFGGLVDELLPKPRREDVGRASEAAEDGDLAKLNRELLTAARKLFDDTPWPNREHETDADKVNL